MSRLGSLNNNFSSTILTDNDTDAPYAFVSAVMSRDENENSYVAQEYVH